MTSKKRHHQEHDQEAQDMVDQHDQGRFADTWATLATAGICDEKDTAEYSRVLREWFDARRPEPLVSFIRRAANRPPEGGA